MGGVSSRELVSIGFVVSSAVPIIGRVRIAGAGRPGRVAACRQSCILPVSWTPNLPVKAEQTYTITELAREFAITSRAIRFYEDQGLLQPARVGRARGTAAPIAPASSSPCADGASAFRWRRSAN